MASTSFKRLSSHWAMSKSLIPKPNGSAKSSALNSTPSIKHDTRGPNSSTKNCPWATRPKGIVEHHMYMNSCVKCTKGKGNGENMVCWQERQPSTIFDRHISIFSRQSSYG